MFSSDKLKSKTNWCSQLTSNSKKKGMECRLNFLLREESLSFVIPWAKMIIKDKNLLIRFAAVDTVWGQISLDTKATKWLQYKKNGKEVSRGKVCVKKLPALVCPTGFKHTYNCHHYLSAPHAFTSNNHVPKDTYSLAKTG